MKTKLDSNWNNVEGSIEFFENSDEKFGYYLVSILVWISGRAYGRTYACYAWEYEPSGKPTYIRVLDQIVSEIDASFMDDLGRDVKFRQLHMGQVVVG